MLENKIVLVVKLHKWLFVPDHDYLRERFHFRFFILKKKHIDQTIDLDKTSQIH